MRNIVSLSGEPFLDEKGRRRALEEEVRRWRHAAAGAVARYDRCSATLAIDRRNDAS